MACIDYTALIARFMGPTWGPPGVDRTQVGSMLAPRSLLSRRPLWVNNQTKQTDFTHGPTHNCITTGKVSYQRHGGTKVTLNQPVQLAKVQTHSFVSPMEIKHRMLLFKLYILLQIPFDRCRPVDIVKTRNVRMWIIVALVFPTKGLLNTNTICKTIPLSEKKAKGSRMYIHDPVVECQLNLST